MMFVNKINKFQKRLAHHQKFGITKYFFIENTVLLPLNTMDDAMVEKVHYKVVKVTLYYILMHFTSYEHKRKRL